MKKLIYDTTGTCSRQISITLDDNGLIEEIVFFGGCHGNLQGIAALVKGMTPEFAIERLKGIRCRDKATSCPDQLSKALEQMIR